MIFALVWTAALALTLAVAALRGGRDERMTAVVLLLADLASYLHPPTRWRRLDHISAVLDLALLAFLLHRALITTRWWPLYACAAQLGACLGLLAYAINSKPLLLAYHTNAVVWSYGILASLLLGTLLEVARLRKEPERAQ